MNCRPTIGRVHLGIFRRGTAGAPLCGRARAYKDAGNLTQDREAVTCTDCRASVDAAPQPEA